ncbi:UDP-glucuronosyltransferase-like isoform X2 [Channa argus]|uniref:UDP-glucuronosyltransferase-like isoform X2 n=1 Tax=Channa argus TaxID=215402 RepID=UPI003522AC95
MSSGVWFPTLGLVIWLCCLGPSQEGKILVVPVDGSHWLSMKILVKELVHRGHEILVLVPETSMVIHGSENYKTEIYTLAYTKDELEEKFNKMRDEVFQRAPGIMDFFHSVQRFVEFTLIQMNGCESLLNNQSLMTRLRGEGFDLVLTDPFLPCGSILAHTFSIPAVYLLRGLPCGLHVQANQCPSPVSYVPVFSSDNTGVMTFPQRVKNMFIFFMQPYVCKMIYAHFDDLVSRYLGDITTYKDLISHGAIWLIRDDFAFEWPRPLLPNMFFVGGINCAKKAPLPPVLWRYTGVPPKDVPKNVRLMKWLPQNDLLAHPKAKVFITHGGTHGVYEGICNAVPMFIFSLFADQHENAHRMVTRGVAKTVTIHDVTTERIVDALNKLIHDKSYKEKIVKLSQIHLDRPIEPLDLAAFWTEFVIKHKGAAHLRVAAHDLNWIQYHSLDVIGILLIILLTVVWVMLKCCLFCTRKCCRKGAPKTKSE